MMYVIDVDGLIAYRSSDFNSMMIIIVLTRVHLILYIVDNL